MKIQNPKSYDWEPTQKIQDTTATRSSSSSKTTPTKKIVNGKEIQLDVRVVENADDGEGEPEFSTMFTQVLHKELKRSGQSMSPIKKNCNGGSRPNSRVTGPVPMSSARTLKKGTQTTIRNSATRSPTHPVSWSRM